MAKQIRSPGLEFENQVRTSLKKIGFKDVDGGPNFRVAGHQIDCCAGWDDVLIIFECTQSSTGTGSVRNLILELRGKRMALSRGFKVLKGYEHYARFVLAIVTKNITYTDGDWAVAREKPEVHLIDEQNVRYYLDLSKKIERGALFNFLGELNIEPRDLEFPRLPAFRITLGKEPPVYLFWCEPHELLKISYVARRESGREHYYQRLLSSDRLRAVRKYIDDGGVFPNNVILAFDSRPTFRRKPSYDEGWPQWLEFGELLFPRSYRSAWIIDGQHRLYAFSSKTPNPQAQKLAVLAFERLSLDRQAKFFIDINHEQKPVTEDLILDLEGDLRPDTDRGRIANCIKQLNILPTLKDKIFLPLSGDRPRGQLKISGLYIDFRETGLLNPSTVNMTHAQKNPLVSGSKPDVVPQRVARAVSDFLTDVKELLSENLWSGVLLRPGGLTVALHVYERVLVHIERVPNPEERRKYAKALAACLQDLAPSEDKVRDIRRGLTSYAQRREVLREVLLCMRERLGDQEFDPVGVPRDQQLQRLIDFERKLAQFAASCLNISTIADLKQRAPEAVWREIERILEKERKTNQEFTIHEAFGLGHIKQIIERKDNSDVIIPRFLDPLIGFATPQEALGALEQIKLARDSMAHGRKQGNKKLINAYLETFERVLGS